MRVALMRTLWVNFIEEGWSNMERSRIYEILKEYGLDDDISFDISNEIADELGIE